MTSPKQQSPLKTILYSLAAQEGYVEVLPGVASREVPPHVDVVVAEDPGDDVGGGDALGALGGHEHAPLLERLVGVLPAAGGVGGVVVGDKVDLVLAQELVTVRPGGVADLHARIKISNFISIPQLDMQKMSEKSNLNLHQARKAL